MPVLRSGDREKLGFWELTGSKVLLRERDHPHAGPGDLWRDLNQQQAGVMVQGQPRVMVKGRGSYGPIRRQDHLQMKGSEITSRLCQGFGMF